MEPKTKIIKAAIKVFLQKGYEAASMTDVVDESQISKGGIYHHFKNKDDLFLQCIDFMFAEFHNWEMLLYSQSQDLKSIMRIYFSSLSQIHGFICGLIGSSEIEIDSFYYLMMEAFIKFPQIKEKHAAVHQEGMDTFVQLLRQAQQQNVIKPELDCKTIGLMVNALAEGIVIYHILNERIDLNEVGQKFFQTLWDGIAVNPVE